MNIYRLEIILSLAVKRLCWIWVFEFTWRNWRLLIIYFSLLSDRIHFILWELFLFVFHSFFKPVWTFIFFIFSKFFFIFTDIFWVFIILAVFRRLIWIIWFTVWITVIILLFFLFLLLNSYFIYNLSLFVFKWGIFRLFRFTIIITAIIWFITAASFLVSFILSYYKFSLYDW